MYASMIGITHPITGPIASSSSDRQGCENQTENPTHATVSVAAPVNRSDGRSPNAGRLRAVNPPSCCVCVPTPLTRRTLAARAAAVITRRG